MNLEVLLRTLAGMLSISMLLLPGFLLSLMLFKQERLAWQLVASLCVSVMVVGGGALVLSYTPFGITYTSLVITMLLLSGVLLTILVATRSMSIVKALVQLQDLLVAVRKNVSIVFVWTLFTLALVCTPALVRTEREQYTEFFFVDGYFSGSEVYWHQENLILFLDVTVGIRSHESTSVIYELQIIDNEQEIGVIQLGEVQPGAGLKRSIRLPGNIESHEYRFLLYKDNSDRPYRELSFSLGKS